MHDLIPNLDPFGEIPDANPAQPPSCTGFAIALTAEYPTEHRNLQNDLAHDR